MSYGNAKDADALAMQRWAAAQRSETAEDIVRAIASEEPTTGRTEGEDSYYECAFCGQGTGLPPEIHEDYCYWRRCAEWVASEDPGPLEFTDEELVAASLQWWHGLDNGARMADVVTVDKARENAKMRILERAREAGVWSYPASSTERSAERL